jgi:hypothetical protein
MKKLVLILSLVLFTISVNSQSKNSLIFGDAMLKYKKMETTGVVMTAIGGIVLFSSNVLYWKSYNNDDKTGPKENKVKTYRNLMFGGLGLMAVGIPLWAIGRTKERHITIEAEIVRYNHYASANGIGLKVRF